MIDRSHLSQWLPDHICRYRTEPCPITFVIVVQSPLTLRQFCVMNLFNRWTGYPPPNLRRNKLSSRPRNNLVLPISFDDRAACGFERRCLLLLSSIEIIMPKHSHSESLSDYIYTFDFCLSVRICLKLIMSFDRCWSVLDQPCPRH